MRVFDSYYFNIIDKVSFGETMPYLEKMLSELGISYKGIGFDLYDLTDEAGPKAVEMFPALAKYTFSEKGYGLMSYTENWREGEIYADPADIGDITAMLSKVPEKLQFWFGKLVFGGVKWFEDSDDTIVPELDYTRKYPHKDKPFLLNGIVPLFSRDKSKKLNRVCVCIEVKDEAQVKAAREIIEKMSSYFGEIEQFSRRCVFTEEETESVKSFKKEERTRLRELAKNSLPEPRPHKPWANPHVMPQPDPKLNHVADKFTLDKAFKGTAFSRQKGQPNWLSLYSFTDEHGFLYEAYVQKLTYCITNDFRVWAAVSGCNFSLTSGSIDYYVTEEGESLEILKQFAEFCVKLSEEYGGELAEKFGETPAWYYDRLT